MDLGEIEVQFQIRNYAQSGKGNWDGEWRKVDFSFSSDPGLNYHCKNEAILLACETEDLNTALTKPLKEKLEAPVEVSFIEPDFKFVLYPKYDVKKILMFSM